MTIARNPIIAGFAPDPSICRRGNDFFLVTSSFNYWPGLPLYHSCDLANWTQVGHILSRPSQLHLPLSDPSEGVYAPTIRCADGVFYVTSTNTSFGGNFVVWTDDPFGDWSDPVWLDQSGIDPGLAFCSDGRVLLATTATGGGVANDPTRTRPGIVISEIDLHTGQRSSDVRELTRGWVGQFPEGPRFVERGEFWYLLLAEGGTELGHMVTIGRAREADGPYEPCPMNPILSHRSQQDAIQATGHADLVEAADGSWWLVCLGTRPVGHPLTHQLGRETFLCPVEWVDDWPVVGTVGRVAPETVIPWASELGPIEPVGEVVSWADPRWLSLGNRVEGAVRTECDGLRLAMEAHSPDLTQGSGASMCLMTQRDHAFAANLTVEFPASNAEVGLVIWMDAEHHYQVGITSDSTSTGAEAWAVVARRRVGTLVGEQRAFLRCPSDAPIRLRVASDGHDYTLGWLDQIDTYHEVDRGRARYLSSEVAGGFTGAMLGPYVTGPPGAFAEIRCFEYRAAEYG